MAGGSVRRVCSYLRSETNYKMRDTRRPDWDWVFLQKVEWDGTRYQATYFLKGGMGDLVTIPAAAFHKEFRRMRREG